MIRNENDIILPFLRQCAALFDGLLVADISSTDGTTGIINSFPASSLDLRVYEVHREEKFQGALMNRLSREAFAAGADWVFLLDADEFLDVTGRPALEQYLGTIGTDLLMLPWINLIPSTYSTYDSFDAAQAFSWSGRASSYCKAAISSVFAATYPDYVIHEGNHAVSRAPGAEPIWDRPGLPILHVPVRSIDRLRVKISSARRITEAKHNRGEGEGTHVFELDAMLARGVDKPTLDYIAAHYGQPLGRIEAIRPDELGWPVRRLPAFVAAETDQPPTSYPREGISHTLRLDAAVDWDKTGFVTGTVVAAAIDGKQIRIVPQSIRGDGRFREPCYRKLPPLVALEHPAEDLLTEIVSMAGLVPKAWAFSAWSELIPVMYALVTTLRPRRFVELGVHNGMSFFAACQVVERLGLATECVAVDSWIGDEHAGFHDTRVFDDFCAYLKANYPHQHYIRSLFDSARSCFDDGSVDLLHIDGLHTYEAVKDDFESWLPKMSANGVIIFHDINVYERGFGVWRLWEELKERFPAFGFAHKHGLGIIFVGREPHPFATILRQVSSTRRRSTLAQAYFESVGSLIIKHRELEWRADEAAASLTRDSSATEARLSALTAQRQAAETEAARLRQRELEQAGAHNERLRVITDLQSHNDQVTRDLDAIRDSTVWRATWPVRRLFLHLPGLRATLRRAFKLCWWTLTGQLPRRLRARKGSTPR